MSPYKAKEDQHSKTYKKKTAQMQPGCRKINARLPSTISIPFSCSLFSSPFDHLLRTGGWLIEVCCSARVCWERVGALCVCESIHHAYPSEKVRVPASLLKMQALEKGKGFHCAYIYKLHFGTILCDVLLLCNVCLMRSDSYNILYCALQQCTELQSRLFQVNVPSK